jgi:hypothetical protein
VHVDELEGFSALNYCCGLRVSHELHADRTIGALVADGFELADFLETTALGASTCALLDKVPFIKMQLRMTAVYKYCSRISNIIMICTHECEGLSSCCQ